MDHQLRNSDAVLDHTTIRAVKEPMQRDSSLPISDLNHPRSTQDTYIPETHTFSPGLLNELHIGFSREALDLAGIRFDPQKFSLENFGKTLAAILRRRLLCDRKGESTA